MTAAIRRHIIKPRYTNAWYISQIQQQLFSVNPDSLPSQHQTTPGKFPYHLPEQQKKVCKAQDSMLLPAQQKLKATSASQLPLPSSAPCQVKGIPAKSNISRMLEGS